MRLGKALAIFDVDGTLVSGRSTEKRFMAWLLRRGHLGPLQLVSAGWFIVRWFPRFGRHVFRKNKAYLNGLPVSLVAHEAKEFVASVPDADWIGPALAQLRQHKEKGDVVVLLSGTLQPIVECLSSRLGADGSVGAECFVEQERFTASPPSRHPFFDEKADMLVSICETYHIAASDVYAYADSGFDIPLLRKVGYPVAVCPDRKLAEWTASHDHPTLK
jgi:HAD superfamily phosphoserine phosphatase-like hydrolase